MLQTINDRLLLILEENGGRDRDLTGPFDREKGANVAYKGFWLMLEKETGVRASKWRHLAANQQKATAEMIQAVARRWPCYAFWLTTGITDIANGHHAPRAAVTFPEFANAQDTYSSDYFHASLRLLAEFESALSDVKSARKVESLGKAWMSESAESSAYSLASSEQYEQLRKLWLDREAERNTEHVPRLNGLQPSEQKRAHHAVPHQHTWDLFYKDKSSG